MGAMAGWRSKLFGISSAQSPWVNIPELRGVPHARAFYAYERANARLKWGRAWCAGLLAATLVIVGWAILNPLLDRAFGRIIALFWIKCLVQALVTVLSVRLFQKITHQSLRRSIRAELGSHCSRCDYDLRGMEKPSDHAPIWLELS